MIYSEEGLTYLPYPWLKPVEIRTPTGVVLTGTTLDTSNIVAISIIRAGDSLLNSFLRIYPEVSVGKILIQRDESTAQPILYYKKLPNLHEKHVILLDPMLATGGSSLKAVQVLLDNGAKEENITFMSVISCPEGVAHVSGAYSKIGIITGELDQGLNDKVCLLRK